MKTQIQKKCVQVYPETSLRSHCLHVIHRRANVNSKCNSSHSSEALPPPVAWVCCVYLWAVLGWGVQTMQPLSESLMESVCALYEGFSSTPQENIEVMCPAGHEFEPAGHESPVCAGHGSKVEVEVELWASTPRYTAFQRVSNYAAGSSRGLGRAGRGTWKTSAVFQRISRCAHTAME